MNARAAVQLWDVVRALARSTGPRERRSEAHAITGVVKCAQDMDMAVCTARPCSVRQVMLRTKSSCLSFAVHVSPVHVPLLAAHTAEAEAEAAASRASPMLDVLLGGDSLSQGEPQAPHALLLHPRHTQARSR